MFREIEESKMGNERPKKSMKELINAFKARMESLGDQEALVKRYELIDDADDELASQQPLGAE